MTISRRTHAQNTHRMRARLWSRVESGMNVDEAVRNLWPIYTDKGGRHNTSRVHTFRLWEKRGLWPPSKAELTEATKTGWIRTRAVPKPLHSDRNAVERGRQLLTTMTERNKEWTGGRMRKETSIRTKIIAARVPVDLIDQIRALRGTKTEHLEKAIRLYLEVLKPENKECGKTPGD